MSHPFESLDFLPRGWDVRLFDSQLRRSVFLLLLALLFMLGAAAPKTPDADSAGKARADIQEPVRIAQPIAITTKTDYAGWTFSALLVGVGAFQAVLLLGTMRAIQAQAGIMRGQLTKMEESLKVTQDSVGFAKRNLEVISIKLPLDNLTTIPLYRSSNAV